MPRPVWTRKTDGADGLALTDSAVIVASCEELIAFDLFTGEIAWDNSTPATSGWTTVDVTREGLVLVGFEERLQAFDLASGPRVEPPAEVAELTDQATFSLPAGYECTDGALSYQGVRIWTGGEDLPYVARFGDFSVINDFTAGVAVVDDTGDVLYDPQLDPRVRRDSTGRLGPLRRSRRVRRHAASDRVRR